MGSNTERGGGRTGGAGETVNCFGTYNICNRRNFWIKYALRVMEQANLYLGYFQDTKVTDGIYVHVSAGYYIIALDALSRHCGVVAILYRKCAPF